MVKQILPDIPLEGSHETIECMANERTVNRTEGDISMNSQQLHTRHVFAKSVGCILGIPRSHEGNGPTSILGNIMLRWCDRAGFIAFVLILAFGGWQPEAGFSVGVVRSGARVPRALSLPRIDAAGVLLHTPLDNAASVANPPVGIGGTTTLLSTDFVPAYVGHGARFAGTGKVVIFPAADSNARNITLDRGEVEFWYQPAYDAAADDIGHHLLVVGDVYNVPSLILTESDRLSLSLTDAGWHSYATQAGWRAPLWSAGQWVHVRATWDATDDDPLRLFVNGVRVDEGSADSGWNLGPETAIGDIFVGAGDAAGDFTADGVIDELIIRDAPQPTATATPTVTPTITPTSDGAAPTATATPAGIGLTDPDMVVTPAPLPLQPVGTPFVDPVFGTTLRRVSNTSVSGGFETHIYSQLQAFSADNTYLLLDGSASFVVRRVSDLSLVAGLDTSEWNVPRWHPTRPHTLIHFDSNADTVIRLQFTDVDTLVTTTVFTFPAQYERIRVNQSFDEVSEDGRWLAGMVTRNDGASMIFTLDLQNLTLGALLPVPDLYAGPCESDPQWPEAEPDWIGVSPLGNYLVVQWARDGITRCSGLETFDLQTGDFVGRVYDGHQHGDLGVDSDGVTELFMTFEMYHPSGNEALGVRQLPGASTVSAPTYVQTLDWIGDHISCRGPHGVCLVTTYDNETGGWSALEGELFLQYTDGSVLRLVHHRSSGCGYWVQPRASMSRDGRYVVFASDWGQETGTDSCGSGNSLGGGDPYIIDLLAGSSDFPAACTPDADGNGFVNILDIQARASDAICLTYLPLIANYWHQTWPAVQQ